MSIVEDLRHALRDLIFPDLQELETKVDALEENIDRRFGAVDQQFQSLRAYFDSRFNSLEGRDLHHTEQ